MWKHQVMRGMVAALALVATFGYAADKADKVGGNVAKDDRAFIMEAAQGGMKEVQMGKLAQQKGQSDGVKQFGQRLEQDHGKANDELKQIAQKLNVSLPDALDKKHQGQVDKFQKLSGAEFDRQFAKAMVDDHQGDIKKFRKEADKGKNPELKQFASQTVPTLEEHLKMAQDLAGTKAKGRK